MQDESLSHLNFNAQTQRLRDTVQQGECLTTRRAERLAQVFLCEGCCCGRADKGFPPLPKAMMKETWKSLKLNATIQLTISGCLGPCDVANVVYLLASDGTGLWFGGLTEEWQYATLIAWAVECRQAGFLLPLPAALDGHRFTRFDLIVGRSGQTQAFGECRLRHQEENRSDERSSSDAEHGHGFRGG